MIMAQSVRQAAGTAETVTHDALVARAAALAPRFAERVGEADRLRRVPDANVAELRQAGLFKVLQARRYGGHQASLRTHIDVVAEIARGCTSTAWCVGVIHAHSWLMGLFPEAAQQDTYGSDPETLISAVIAPRGKARAVAGGYTLSGFWPFGSGSQHAGWLFLGAAVENASGEVIDEADLLVPVADVTIKDDWNVTGLRGTGSCSIVAKDVFVPGHRYLSLRAAIGGSAPGPALHEGWLYRSAVVPVLTLAIAPAALGAAQLAFDTFTKKLPGREVAYTQRELQIEMPVTHLQVAEAATKIDVARLLALSLRRRDPGCCRARRRDGVREARAGAHGVRPCGAPMPRGGRDALSRLGRLRHRRGQSDAACLARRPRHQHAWAAQPADQPGDVRPHPAGTDAEHAADLSGADHQHSQQRYGEESDMKEKSSREIARALAGASRRSVLRGLAAGMGAVAAPAILSSKARAAGRAIKLGFVSPETGPIAAFGEADEFVLTGLRDVLATGVTINGVQHPVTIVKKDSQSNPNRAAEVAAEPDHQRQGGHPARLLHLGHGQSGRRPGEVNGVPCISTDDAVAGLLLRPQGQSGKGLRMDLSFLLGRRGRSPRSSPICGMSLDTNKKVGGLWTQRPGRRRAQRQGAWLPAAVSEGRLLNLSISAVYPSAPTTFPRRSRSSSRPASTSSPASSCRRILRHSGPRRRSRASGRRSRRIAKALLFPSSVEALGTRGVGLSTRGLVVAAPSLQVRPDRRRRPSNSATPIPIDTGKAMDPADRLQARADRGRARRAEAHQEHRRARLDPWRRSATTDYALDRRARRFASRARCRCVATTPLVGGQWKHGTKNKYDLNIVNNQTGGFHPAGQQVRADTVLIALLCRRRDVASRRRIYRSCRDAAAARACRGEEALRRA